MLDYAHGRCKNSLKGTITLARNRKTMLYTLCRALSASPDEWRVRVSQKTREMLNGALAKANRSLLPRDGYKKALSESGRDIAGWWRARDRHWFLGSTDIMRVRQYYADHDGLADSIIGLADRVLEDEFPIPGRGLMKCVGSDRWHRDPVAGIVSPLIYQAKIDCLDANTVGDSKNVWEPSRFGWAYWLGMAYVLTEEPAYAEKFRELTLDWFAHNPYPFGIHYASALELGFRAYAWVWALDFFHEYLIGHTELLDRLVCGIWTSCRHIESFLSYYYAPNTHLTGEAFALYACGAALPEFKEAARWRDLGSKILAREAKRQFHADGTHRELSSCYHLYSTDFYLQATLIADRTGLPIDGEIEPTARRLAVRLARLAPDTLQLSQFNDCDGGRLTWFCHEPLDAAPSLFAARQLWNSNEFPAKESPHNGYHLWMRPRVNSAATTAVAADDSLKDEHAERIAAGDYKPDSGIIAYQNEAGDYLLFRSGPFGYMDCGHSHDTPTSFVLYLAGRPLLVDCGTGSYTKSREIRDRFRGGLGKNILLVDGKGPSLPGDWFNWNRKSDARLTKVERFPGGFTCEGEYEAFSSAAGFRVKVGRRLTLLDEGILSITDRWQAEKPVSCSIPFTLHPGITPQQSESGVLLRDEDGGTYSVTIQYSTTTVDETAEACSVLPRIVKRHYSPGYGVITETDYLECTFPTSAEGRVVTTVSRAVGMSDVNLARMEAAAR